MKINARRCLITLAITTLLSAPVQAAAPGIPATIDRFVAKLFPNAKHYFWIVNNAQTATETDEMILDLNAFVKDTYEGPLMENRYLILIMNGQILAAQHIPLDSNVDCGKDEEI